MSTRITESYGEQKDRTIQWMTKNDNDLTAVKDLADHEYVFDAANYRSISNTGIFVKLRDLFVDVFLPQGYPESVTDDYLQYQIWDTVQAFASSITGALATEAVLKGAGVGDQTASALGATLSWLLKDGVGHVGRIVFAWARGTQLDADCKKWRLFADILNDLAMCIDLLAPYFRFAFTYIVCVSSLCRSIVGVAGGATRAALTQHQARRNNLADVSAKDGSQETLVNLIALICSLLLLPVVSGHTLWVWTLFVLFTTLHLYANYRAVRSLQIDTLNRKRLLLCVRSFVNTGQVLDVALANSAEPLFHNLSKSRHFGCSLRSIGDQPFGSTAWVHQSADWRFVLHLNKRGHGRVALTVGATVEDQLRAAVELEYYYLARRRCSDQIFRTFHEQLLTAGWRLHVVQLEFDEWRYSTKKFE